MKIVLLLAGKGRRMKALTNQNHKALIKLDDFPLLHYLIDNISYAQFTEIIPIIGHCSDKIISCFNTHDSSINIIPIYNEFYSSRNNLYSLFCARNILEGEEFILCNGDIIFDREIFIKIKSLDNHSAIAIDDFNYLKPIDSPGILMKEDKISDLGRHIPFSNNKGYAIGIYKFNSELSLAFFKEAKHFLELDLNSGFHDPLQKLFDKHPIYKCSIDGCLWTDIDEQSDIVKATKINKILIDKYAEK